MNSFQNSSKLYNQNNSYLNLNNSKEDKPLIDVFNYENSFRNTKPLIPSLAGQYENDPEEFNFNQTRQ
jgi:hypothetical protein